MSLLPLQGRRVLVTRAAHQAGKLSNALRSVGAEPVEVPVLEIGPPVSFGPLDSALRVIHSYDWLIFTSANTVQAVAERAAVLSIDLKQTSGRVAAVGEATAASARKAGLMVAIVPESYVAESLVAEMAAQVAGQRVLLARAAVARDVIPDALRAAGAVVDVVDAYRNTMPAGAADRLKRALAEGVDAVTFTSSSSVTQLAEAARAGGVAWPFAGVAAISIGPITSRTLRELGWDPAIEAVVSNIGGLVDAAVRVLEIVEPDESIR